MFPSISSRRVAAHKPPERATIERHIIQRLAPPSTRQGNRRCIDVLRDRDRSVTRMLSIARSRSAIYDHCGGPRSVPLPRKTQSATQSVWHAALRVQRRMARPVAALRATLLNNCGRSQDRPAAVGARYGVGTKRRLRCVALVKVRWVEAGNSRQGEDLEIIDHRGMESALVRTRPMRIVVEEAEAVTSGCARATDDGHSRG
ncbi:hypothetical protein F4780DRAFT_107511 [Xylariomycetidae sp. FL0641]|nr:hypothetical protein F4780DRAFT_107511 [Xylariomycetidae sp. FL0641]